MKIKNRQRIGYTLLTALMAVTTGCGNSNRAASSETASKSDENISTVSDINSTESNASVSVYIIHNNITATVFWTGESGNDANAYIPNLASAWDDLWMQHFGGIDDPLQRDDWLPTGFVPAENPFYVALPFNDFDADGVRKSDLAFIPWSFEAPAETESVCKNRWVRIEKNGKSAFAQWEDVGPFGENDRDYVFGNALPSNTVNNHAGIDVSPAIRDYLELSDIDKVAWQFVDEANVPEGPWSATITRSDIDWKTWYKPASGTSWQWQLTGTVNTAYSVDVYDIDLFDIPAKTIDALHQKGKKVICYFSAGSYEEWREDAADFPDDVLGNKLHGWEGERWLDIRSESLRPIMAARFDLAVLKGCDGIEPDNIDGYTNPTGFPLTDKDQLEYNKWLSLQAHERSLSIGLKNDGDQVRELEPFFDFSVNEQCHEYEECNLYQPFISAGKPVFNAEYDEHFINSASDRDALCSQSEQAGLQTLVLPMNLDDSFRYSCEEE